MFNFKCGGMNNEVHTLVSDDVVYNGLSVCAMENNTYCVVFTVVDSESENVTRMSGTGSTYTADHHFTSDH